MVERDTYRKIKRMSREELQAFLIRYADGLQEQDNQTVDLREMENDLRQIKVSERNALKKSWQL